MQCQLQGALHGKLWRMILIYKNKFVHTISNKKQSDYLTGENYFTVRKRALLYIHPCTLYVGFMIRIGAKLTVLELGLGQGLHNRLN